MTTNLIPENPAQAFAPGKTVAESLTLKQKLSDGDTGTRWLAQDGDSGKDVELLVLPAAVTADARALDELRAQVKLNRQLIHPHVLRTHDFIEEEGWAAISSDAVEAESLASLMAKKEKQCFEPSEIKEWLATICQTLDDAHRAQLLHRDIEPHNVLLAGSAGILIANFGISRIILDAVARAKPGAVDEHLATMSPQQLDGELPARWDDVYSLGVFIYQLLTGKAPFHTGDILPQIRKTTPASITARRAELGIAGEPIPSGWEKVVAACLEKHTPGRPKSAREVGLKLAAESPAATAAPQAAPVAAPVPSPSVVPAVSATPAPAAPAPAVKQAETPAPAKPAPAPATPSAQPVAQTKTPAPDTEKTAKSKPEEEKTPAEESLVDDIVWRKPPPQAAPGAPASFKHLLERVPEEGGERRTSVFAKLVPLAGVFAVVLVIALIWSRSGKQEKVTAVTTPTPAPSATPATTTVATPAPVPSAAPATPKPTAAVAEATPARTPGILPNTLSPEKMRSLEQARKSVDDLQKSLLDKTQAQQQADAAVTAAKTDVDTKTTALATMKKTADDTAAQRKQSEDAATKAAADAAEAQKVAADKARASDDAKKALDQLTAQAKDQDDAQQKAAAELQALQTAMTGKQQAAADAAKAKDDLQAKLDQQQLALKQAEAEAIAAAATPAPSPASPGATPSADSIPLGTGTAELMPIDGDKGSPASIEAKEQVVLNQITQDKQAQANALATPSVVSTYVPNPKSQIDKTLTNSLGMRFQPVGDVLFCIWLTRVQDFDAFAKATHFKSNSWMQPGFKQGPDHPVVNVSWNDAMAFCKWLTDKERKAGLLAPNQEYRLPTDLEWSKAVGLGEENGKTPAQRDTGIQDVYPWGTQWPPPQGAGNYTGEETGSDVAIKGYDDGYGFTSPVGSFNANKYGLYDMGGNAWQWCMDWWNPEQKEKVLRGASWYNGGLKLSLLSSCRQDAVPDMITDNYGFRVIIATEGKKK